MKKKKKYGGYGIPNRQIKPVKDLLKDAMKKAKLPGKRISKTGKVYYERRINRSDKLGSKI